MTAKILVTANGQQIIAAVKVVENQETQERVAYWVSQPRVITYRQADEGHKTNISLIPYCFASDEAEFSISAAHVVAILEPREDIATAWRKQVFPKQFEEITELQSLDEESETDQG